MRVLAVIPCRNEARHLNGLIDRMLADTAIDLLVVADGGSTDGSREIVESRLAESDRLRLIDNPARIQSAGINEAVARFGTDCQWLVRIDAHCSYPEGYVGLLLAAARAREATSVVVPMATRGECGFQKAVAAAQNSLLGTGGSPHRHVTSGRFVDHGHHALIRIEVFRRIGGYCEAMPCNEDAEFDQRQLALGGRIWLEPQAAIVYHPRSTAVDLWRQYWRYGAGRASNVRRHRSRLKLRQMMPLAVPISAASLALVPLHWLFAVPFGIWGALCLTAGAAAGARQGGGSAHLAGVAAAIMHMAWGTGFLFESVRRPNGVPARYRFDAQAPLEDQLRSQGQC